MWLRSNVFQKKDWIPALFLLFFICVTNVRAEENAPLYTSAEKPQICSEDHCLMLLGPNSSVFNIYDAWGNYLFDRKGALEVYKPLLLSENTIFIESQDDQIVVKSPKARGTIMTLPSEEYSVFQRDGWFQVTSLKDGSSVIYDSSGQPAGPPTEGLTLPDTLPPEWTYYLYACFCRLENGFLYGSSYKDLANWVYAAADGSDSFVIDQGHPLIPVLSKIPSEPIYTIGSYIVDGSGFSEKNGKVYSLSGEMVLDHIIGCNKRDQSSIAPDSYYHPYLYCASRELTDYLIRLEGDTYAVYDKELNRLGEIALDPEGFYSYSVFAHNGSIVGLPSEALGGSICDGFLTNGRRQLRAYAQEGTVWKIESEAGPILLDVPENEKIIDANDYYYKTQEVVETEEGEKYISRIYHRFSDSPAELMLTETDLVRATLIPDGLLVITSQAATPGPYPMTEPVSSTIYGPDGSITCHLGKADIKVIGEGIIYIRQGVYSGVIDSHGTWLLKRVEPRFIE